ncbi:hypothetical protein V1527DRAFT_483013 [Lipomyces starkeyi]
MYQKIAEGFFSAISPYKDHMTKEAYEGARLLCPGHDPRSVRVTANQVKKFSVHYIHQSFYLENAGCNMLGFKVGVVELAIYRAMPSQQFRLVGNIKLGGQRPLRPTPVTNNVEFPIDPARIGAGRIFSGATSNLTALKAIVFPADAPKVIITMQTMPWFLLCQQCSQLPSTSSADGTSSKYTDASSDVRCFGPLSNHPPLYDWLQPPHLMSVLIDEKLHRELSAFKTVS